MHAKKLDKLATAVLYTIAGIIVTILASFDSLHPGSRVTSHLLVFLDWEVFLLSSRWGYWDSALQFLLPSGHYLDHFCSPIYGGWCFPR